MEQNFIDEGCDQCVHEWKWKKNLKKIEGEMFETIPSSQSKNDDTMQKKLMKKVKLETPWQKSSNLGIFLCQWWTTSWC